MTAEVLSTPETTSIVFQTKVFHDQVSWIHEMVVLINTREIHAHVVG